MAITKTVLIACGTGVATSTVMAVAIEEALRERGLRVVIRQCKATEVPSMIDDVDLVVSSTMLPPNLSKPTFVTLAFLTGMGKDSMIEKIVEVLKAK